MLLSPSVDSRQPFFSCRLQPDRWNWDYSFSQDHSPAYNLRDGALRLFFLKGTYYSSLQPGEWSIGSIFPSGPQSSLQSDGWSIGTILPHRTTVQAPATKQGIDVSNNSAASGCLPFHLIPNSGIYLYFYCLCLRPYTTFSVSSFRGRRGFLVSSSALH